MQFLMARSLAGHDKGKVYVVLSDSGGLLSLADGRLRTLDRPKNKKMIHVQMIKNIPPEVVAITDGTENWEDHIIRKVIKEYSRLNGADA